MSIARRTFLTEMVGAVAAGCVISLREVAVQVTFPDTKISLLDLGKGCRLRESCAGYRQALTQMGLPFAEVTPEALRSSRTIIVPAAVEICPATAMTLAVYLRAGTRLLFESAAGFAEPSTFRSHQALLKEQFGVIVDPPLHLWSGDSANRHVPYVDYHWPLPVKVRDFSRVVPVAGGASEAIGWTWGMPVAVKQSMGKGILVFLGSPLGPALWAGDREAHEWLRQVIL